MNAFNGQPRRNGPVRLRPYQEQAVNEINARIAAGVRRLIVVAPTWSGRTTIAAHITRALRDLLRKAARSRGRLDWSSIDAATRSPARPE
jgi:superfamily II DNA or RNA helicase